MVDMESKRYRFLIVFAVWTLLGLNSAMQWLPYRISIGAEGWAVCLFAFIYNYLWAALYPLISRSTLYLIRNSRKWIVAIVGQLPMGLVYSSAHLGLYYLNYLFFKHFVGVDYYRKDISGFVNSFFHSSLIFYFQIVAIIYLLDYRRKLKEKDKQLTMAQLQSLKMQLQPHFLFNTLHSIQALIEEDPAVAEDMLVNLSDFLRLTLATTNETEIPLEREIDFVRAYLSIEQMRFQDRLSIDFDLESESLHAMVPALLLQPLVENSIRHGIAPFADKGSILIKSRVERSDLIVVVQDSDSQKRDTSTFDSKAGLGLSNVRTRLEKHFGQNQSLEIDTVADGSFAVTITLPFRKGTASRQPDHI